MYALAHSGRAPIGVPEGCAEAVAVGALDARRDVDLRTVAGLMARLRELGVTPEEEQDDPPDVGPSERDRRQLEDAQVRLRELIRADGVTETGDRWLYDAAAEEIVRLRRMNAEIDQSSLALAADAQHGREQGAAEMRERAAALCDDEAKRAAARGDHEQASTLWWIRHGIRALPLDAPREALSTEDALDVAGNTLADERIERTARALIDLGIKWARAFEVARLAEEEGGASPENGHRAVLHIARSHSPAWSMPEPDELRRAVRALVGSAGLLAEDATRIRADKAPAAEQKRPEAEAGQEVSPAAGEGSVAEERGVSQEATRRPCLPVWVIGSSKPGCMAHAPGDARCTIGAASSPDGALRCVGCGSERGPADKPHACAHRGLPKPARVGLDQLWRDEGRICDLIVYATFSDGRVAMSGSRGLEIRVETTANDMLSDPRWRFVGYAKPSSVQRGYRWRVVGVDDDLEVRRISAEGVQASLGPVDVPGVATLRARTGDMLSLDAWTFLGPAPAPPEPECGGGEDERGSPAAAAG
jgi:hypothetical protein